MAREGREEVSRQVAMSMRGATALHEAAWNGHKEVVELLLSQGADKNATDHEGKTVLHSAAWRGNKEIVELLLSKNAEINIKDKFGWTALHLAVEESERRGKAGHKEVVVLLRGKGASDIWWVWTVLFRLFLLSIVLVALYLTKQFITVRRKK